MAKNKTENKRRKDKSTGRKSEKDRRRKGNAQKSIGRSRKK